MPTMHKLLACHPKAGLNVRVADAGELRGIERGGSGQLPPAGPPSPGVPPLPNAPEVSSTTTSAQATKGSDDTRNPELFCMEDAEATVETLLLMEFADLGTLDQTITSGKLRGDLVRALSCSIVQLPLFASMRFFGSTSCRSCRFSETRSILCSTFGFQHLRIPLRLWWFECQKRELSAACAWLVLLYDMPLSPAR